MEQTSHLQLITMCLLQTCSYVSDQMPSDVTIDVNKFLEAFSIEVDGQHIRPPSWIQSEGDSVTIVPSSPILLAASPSEPDASSSGIFNMDNYRRCRQAEAIRWIDLEEKRASIIPRLQPTSAEEYQKRREAVTFETGPLRRKQKKQMGMKSISYLFIRQNVPHTFWSLANKRTVQFQNPTKNNRSSNMPMEPSDLLSRR